MKLPLETKNFGNPWFRPSFQWSASLPFVENKWAALIHRPFAVRQFTRARGSHISVHYHCGNSANGTHRFTFLDLPPTDSIVCARCEMMAIGRGMPSSAELAGRHVCLGGAIAYSECHGVMRKKSQAGER